jgi:branched-chain amino acid transport system permease protein
LSVDGLLLLQQTLNALQLGVMLFLLAAGLTLVFGIMDLINLAHGSFYMVGAFLTAWLAGQTGSFLLALSLAVPLTALVGLAVERVALRGLYARDHLYQVLATFGLILFFNDAVRLLFGPVPIFLDPPAALRGQVELFGAPYPAFRLAIIGVGLGVALFLWWLIGRTRIGMWVRAGASNREMLTALGVDVRLLFTLVFALAAGLAALAGAMAGPILAVRVGMGEDILILAFVVVVLGGVGSIRGAFVGALVVGLVDTFGRAFLPSLLGDAAGASLASMGIYVVMALVLAFRPKGLLPAVA